MENGPRPFHSATVIEKREPGCTNVHRKSLCTRKICAKPFFSFHIAPFHINKKEILIFTLPEVECPPPPSPQNGYVTGKAPYKAGDLAQVECRPGYMMEGQSIIACQDNGKWSRASSTTKCTTLMVTYGLY